MPFPPLQEVMRTLRPPMLGRKGQRRRQRWMQKRHPCMTHSGIIRRKAVRHFLRSPIQLVLRTDSLPRRRRCLASLRSSTFSCLICLRHTPLLYRRKRMSTRFTAYPRTTDKLGSRPY
ncbi:hypothetical protein RHGRI_029490 [Rhododendron griersonianum]|uniref:Ribosomal protein S14 n=1 Tax=Rhododendron griersonianum TaxID=479676 RepID=A0AAV6ILU7_9ERIC|nr:hypothetical protein RHGRI_029490 [Rhododendron griersonianum]